MATQSIATLKNWFKTGLKPLQQQFWDWLDSFRHVSVKITFNDLDNDLQNTINAAALPANKIVLPLATYSYNILAGLTINGILFEDATNPADIKVGNVAGGEQIYNANNSVNGYCLQSGMYHFAVNTTIYFTNITPTTVITIFKA